MRHKTKNLDIKSNNFVFCPGDLVVLNTNTSWYQYLVKLYPKTLNWLKDEFFIIEEMSQTSQCYWVTGNITGFSYLFPKNQLVKINET